MDLVLDRILKILNEKSINEKKVLLDLEINTSFFSDWKKSKIKSPSYDKIAKISNYLGVSIDYLVNGVNYNSTTELKNDLKEDEIELLKLYRQFTTKERYKILGMLEMKLMIEQDLQKDDKKIISSH